MAPPTPPTPTIAFQVGRQTSDEVAALEGYQSWLGSRKVEVLTTYDGNGQAYPGDDVVDQVSHDIKDAAYHWGNALGGYVYPLPSSGDTACQNGRHEHVWSQSEGPTMVADANFATRHGKPFSLGEWGVAWRLDGHGGNDNPGFIQHIDDTRLRSGKFPNAAAKDRELFGRWPSLDAAGSCQGAASLRLCTHALTRRPAVARPGFRPLRDRGARL